MKIFCNIFTGKISFIETIFTYSLSVTLNMGQR